VIANPPPTKITWFHPNSKAAIGENFLAARVNATTSTLSIVSVRIDDYGNYSVEVTNDVGSSTYVFLLTRAGK
jgi:hypothetical protein